VRGRQSPTVRSRHRPAHVRSSHRRGRAVPALPWCWSGALHPSARTRTVRHRAMRHARGRRRGRRSGDARSTCRLSARRGRDHAAPVITKATRRRSSWYAATRRVNATSSPARASATSTSSATVSSAICRHAPLMLDDMASDSGISSEARPTSGRPRPRSGVHLA